MTRNPNECPADCAGAYDWINAAGEWDEALSLTGEALMRYADEAAANWHAEGDGVEVLAEDVLDAIAWERARRAARAVRS